MKNFHRANDAMEVFRILDTTRVSDGQSGWQNNWKCHHVDWDEKENSWWNISKAQELKKDLIHDDKEPTIQRIVMLYVSKARH